MNVEALQATTADGITLRGEVVRGDGTFVVLVHDVGEDIDVWKPIRLGLVKRGWTVLAMDLRGHGGSDGDWSPERAELDVDLPVTLARRFGARHLAVMASGLGAVFTLKAVERAFPQELFELPDSLVLISPGPLDGLDPMELRAGGMSKLFIFGAKDPLAPDARALVKASIGWTVQTTYGTDARSGALIAARKRYILDKSIAFLNEQRTFRGQGLARFEAKLAKAREQRAEN